MCVRVLCGHARELLMLPPPLVRVKPKPYYGITGMDKQMWDPRLRVDDEAEQSIDFKHRKWEFPLTTKVRAANY